MILSVNIDVAGQSGLTPKFIYLDTNDTIAEVSTTGYLNALVSSGITLSESWMALVSTRTTPNAKPVQVSLFDISYSNGNWSLSPNATPLSLADGKILVGNASGVATAVTMSGDTTISNTGVVTIANNAVTNAKIIDDAVTNTKIIDGAVTVGKIADFNVSYAKLSSTWKPTAIIKYFDFVITAGGGVQETFAVPGADPSQDIVFPQAISDTTGAYILKAEVPIADSIRITWNADPGAGNVIWYQLVRNAF